MVCRRRNRYSWRNRQADSRLVGIQTQKEAQCRPGRSHAIWARRTLRNEYRWPQRTSGEHQEEVGRQNIVRGLANWNLVLLSCARKVSQHWHHLCLPTLSNFCSWPRKLKIAFRQLPGMAPTWKWNLARQWKEHLYIRNRCLETKCVMWTIRVHIWNVPWS